MALYILAELSSGAFKWRISASTWVREVQQVVAARKQIVACGREGAARVAKAPPREVPELRDFYADSIRSTSPRSWFPSEWCRGSPLHHVVEYSLGPRRMGKTHGATLQSPAS